MPVLSKKITQTSAREYFEVRKPDIERALRLLSDDFTQIQKVCGLQLSPVVRERIVQSTELYCASWCNEKKSITARSLLKDLGKARTAALRVLLAVDGRPVKPQALIWKTKKWKTRCIRLAEMRVTSAKAPNSLSNLLSVFLAGLNRLEKRIGTKNSQTIELGRAWQRWIYLISLIAREASLPFGLRRDAHGQVSEGAKLVHQVQIRLPKDMQRKFANDLSLSRAMGDALARERDLAGLSFAGALKKHRRFLKPSLGRWPL